jgi:hypothetical protein
MAGDATTCAERIGGETLSAWRDDLLSSDEMARLRAHTPGCAACQERLADFDAVAAALLRQRELEPSERIVEGVWRAAARRRPVRLIPRGNKRLWAGLGALGSVAAVVLLFIYVFSMVQSGLGSGPQPTANVKPVPSLNPTPTLGKRVVTPPPTVMPSGMFTLVATVQIAWGTNAVKQSLTTRVDATHIFWVSNISPDGRSLLGYEYAVAGGSPDPGVPAQAGVFDLASRRVTTIGVSGTVGYPPGCCMDDGRFLVATDSTQPGATCGICHVRYWSYDTQTGTLWQVAVGGQYQGIDTAYLDHGLLVLGTGGEGIEVADLAARHITPLAGVPPDVNLLAYRWPYVVYVQPLGSSRSETMARDLTTGVVTPLPQVDALSGAMILTGDILFISVLSEDNQVTTLYEMDHFLSSGAQPRQLGRYLGAAGVTAANDRLVSLGTVLYDRLEGLFVSLGPDSGQGGPGAALAANHLATFQVRGGTPGGDVPQQVAIFDTTQLPELIIP